MLTFLTLLSPSFIVLPSGVDVCTSTAYLQAQSARLELRADTIKEIATCFNFQDADDKQECLEDARTDFIEEVELIDEQLKVRLEVCGLLDEADGYDPEIEPESFTNVVDNPYLPFPVGAHWVYEAETDEGLEIVDITVLEETRVIGGVECVSVRDVVYVDGEPVEDTIDWFAQDDEGNVWYFGEISFNFEDGYVEDIDGSWLTGLDGAKPGIVMLANPTIGTTYRQEWLLSEAEDFATVLEIDGTITIDLGRFEHCVVTEDRLAPEPDALEHKYYAKGIGFIFETKPDRVEVLQLVSYSGL